MLLISLLLKLLSLLLGINFEPAFFVLPFKILVQNKTGNTLKFLILQLQDLLCFSAIFFEHDRCGLELLLANYKFSVEVLIVKAIRIWALKCEYLQVKLEVRYLRFTATEHRFFI